MPDRKPLSVTLRQIGAVCMLGLFLAAARPAAAGEAIRNAWDLPPIVLPDLTGAERELYDWSGKVIMLNFWASWCGPCMIEIPHFVRYQKRHAALGLQIIGVGIDDPAPMRNFVRTLGINYPVLVADPQKNTKLLANWGDTSQVLPYTVVIDRDGHIRYAHIGILDQETFDDYVLPLLTPAPRVNTARDDARYGMAPGG